MKRENKIKLEKGTLLVLAMLGLLEGLGRILFFDFVEGSFLITIALLLFFLREHLKFTRWKYLENEYIMRKNKVNFEKGSPLIITTLIMQRVLALLYINNYIGATFWLGVAVGIIYLREHLKFTRWRFKK